MEKNYIINKNFGQRNMNNSLKGFQSGRYGKTLRDFLNNGGFTNLAYFNKFIAVTKSQKRYFSSVSHNASRSRNIASNNVAAFGHGRKYFSNSTRLFMHNNNGFNKDNNNFNKDN